MTNDLNREVIDKLTKTCVCTGTNRNSIKKAVLAGALTFEEVKKSTGAGCGSCKGKRCKEKIEGIISSLNNI